MTDTARTPVAARKQQRTSFWRGFVDHPASVGETYFQHLRFAAAFAGLLFAAGAAALIHALVPSLFETTASRIICKLHARIQARH